jgi:hypothetical protein
MFFKLMEERYHLPLPFPNPLASVELPEGSKGGLNQDRLEVMLSICNQPTAGNLFGKVEGACRRIAFDSIQALHR